MTGNTLGVNSILTQNTGRRAHLYLTPPSSIPTHKGTDRTTIVGIIGIHNPKLLITILTACSDSTLHKPTQRNETVCRKTFHLISYLKISEQLTKWPRHSALTVIHQPLTLKRTKTNLKRRKGSGRYCYVYPTSTPAWKPLPNRVTRQISYRAAFQATRSQHWSHLGSRKPS